MTLQLKYNCQPCKVEHSRVPHLQIKTCHPLLLTATADLKSTFLKDKAKISWKMEGI
jgi:hypothetical protein